MTIPANIEVLVPWRAIGSTPERHAELLSAELLKEVCPEHILFGAKAIAIARRIDRDDVLFELEGAQMPLAVVHLTWRKGTESDPRWPATKFFESWDQWVRDEMLPAHEEYGSS